MFPIVLLMSFLRLCVGLSVEASLQHVTERNLLCRCTCAELQWLNAGFRRSICTVDGIAVGCALRQRAFNLRDSAVQQACTASYQATAYGPTKRTIFPVVCALLKII
jgi:hypothetical protein